MTFHAYSLEKIYPNHAYFFLNSILAMLLVHAYFFLKFYISHAYKIHAYKKKNIYVPHHADAGRK